MRVWAILLSFVSCLTFAEPIRLNKTGCWFYSLDAQDIAVLRDAGIIEESIQEKYASLPYDAHIKPHLIELIHFVYSSSLTPEEAKKALYAECINNEGWIGRAM